MAAVLDPKPVSLGHNAVFDPEALVDPSWMGSQMLSQMFSDPMEANAITEYESLVTPMQHEIIKSGYPQWCQFILALPPGSTANVNRIDTAWRNLSARHPCLRTSFYTGYQDHKIHHRVSSRTSKVIRQPERKVGQSSPNAEGQQHSTAYLTIGQESDDILTLTLNIQRALVDTISLGALKLDFALIYFGFPLQNTLSLPNYVDHMEGDFKRDQANQFWRRTLAAASMTCIGSPVQRSQLAVTGEHRVVSLTLKPDALSPVSVNDSNGKHPRKSLFEALWALVLYRHTAKQDVLFAAAERDRSFEGYATGIGVLEQSYPLRVRISEELSFMTLQESVNDYHDKASPHGHFGLSRILETSLLPQTESFLKYCHTLASPSLAGSFTDFPLIMYVNDHEFVKLTVFHTKAIDDLYAECILQQYANAIRFTLARISKLDFDVGSVELSSEAEQKQILVLANSVKSVEPDTQLHLAKMFEERVDSNPSALAIQFEADNPLNFQELNVLVDHLVLVSNIKRHTFVPVCIDRSVNLIACLLAILKSGAAYVILDPDGAMDRNAHIVKDCGAELVITNRQYATNFKQARVIEDLKDACIEDASTCEAVQDLSPDDPCYIIYTSGSTGAPKGVVLTHKAASNGITHFSLNGRRRWLLFYNPIFSAAQRTMMATLIKGGCLLLASKKSLTTSLASTINDMEADALGITPSALSLLSPTEVPTLQQITLVGETVSPSILSTWSERVELRNTFGLSECTQLNFGRKLDKNSDPRVVGRPTDTTSAYILKPGTIDLAPFATTGELCLAGPQLGHSYLNKADQTAEKFIKNPFGSGKLYRTGDAARQHSNGAIEICGRLDFQIKIAGQRIEPSEIDVALLKHPSIQACATIAATLNEAKSLVAAVVSKDQRSFSALVVDLRRHIQKLLPAYMIPSYWLPLARLPTNANGKIDIPEIRGQVESLGSRRLLDLSNDRDRDEVPFTGTAETALRNTWASVLQLDVASIRHQDTFISLGGSSLQAIKVGAELRIHGIAVDLAMVVGSATLDAIASSCTIISPDVPKDPEPFSMLKETYVRKRYVNDSASDAYPVTPLQEGLLAASLAGHDNYTYQRVWKLAGLDIKRLRAAFETVFDKSDILRTTFVPQGKSYLQIVRTDMQLPWEVFSARLEDYKQSVKKFDVLRGQLLFNIAVVDERYLVVSMHHSLFDFWSHRFLYQDVAAVYFNKGVVERPPFKRYVKYIIESDHKAMNDFWRRQLKGASRTILNHAPSRQATTVEKILDIDFKGKAQALGVTTGSVIYAAWAILLSRHLESNDVSFATTLSGREAPIASIDLLDGPTLTTVPQRIFVHQGKRSLDFVKSINSNLFELMQYAQHGMRRSLSAAGQSPGYFDTMVNVLVGNEEEELSGKLFKRQGPKPTWASEFTTLETEELDAQFHIRISTTMEIRRAQFILDSFMCLIRAILENPAATISSIEIIGDEERSFLANKDKIESVPVHLSLLHSRFEISARTKPDRIAIEWDGTTRITYQELNRRAEKVASCLHRHGICRGSVVPLYLDKSINTVVAIIGTMKAGAAYVPLSPDNPLERNLFIIGDVDGQLILTQRVHHQLLEGHKFRVLDIEETISSTGSEAAPLLDPSPDDTAYIIYTSGSTGSPKGVRVSHRSAAAAVLSMLQAEGRQAGEWRSLQFANYIFDASVQDIFNTLSSGGVLCMAPTEKMLSNLAGTINDLNVKQAILTPTVAKLIEPKDTPGLETMIVGGEPLTSDVAAKWASTRKLLNVYGPTEASMVATTKQIRPNDNPHNIGRPLPTAQVLLMNQDGSDLVPYGATGELCIVGPQLSEGYVNRASDTDPAFTSCERLGIKRMYKTGDLARWCLGGDIECLGRKDHQVKVHGHRIELGEIEQAIAQTRIPHDSVVVATEIDSKPQLAAVAVFDPDASTEFKAADSHQEEKQKLKENIRGLPPYMMPRSILPIGKLPKLPSGKVDRKLLKKWIECLGIKDLNNYSIDGAGSAHEAVPVETDEEQALEQMWSDILGQEKNAIGAQANFFSLGGDSVSAINLVSACRSDGYALSVAHVLKFPVLREMARNLRQIEKTENLDTKQQFIAPEPLNAQIRKSGLDIAEDVEYTFPAPPGQVEFLNQGVKSKQYWVLMTTRRLPATVDVDRWIKAVTALTRNNAILRTFWTKLDTNWIGVVLKHPQVDVMPQNCQDMKQRSDIIEIFWNEPFTFGRPWVRYAVLTLPNGQREIVTKMNHAVYDGTLLRIFDAQFAAIQKGENGIAHEDFRQFALHIWRGDKTESMRFWADFMDQKTFNYPSVNDPTITDLVSKHTEIHLEEFATRCGVTPSVVFQAAFQIWLTRVSGSRDVSFDYLLSGRNVELPNPQLINGNLANILPFRSQLAREDKDDATSNLQGYLEETQRVFWEVTENGNVDIDSIYDSVKISRQQHGNRAMFLFQPFEPAKSEPAPDEMQWVVMKGSEVRMYQPYALVVEVSKAVSGHLVKVMYDQYVFSKLQAEEIAAKQIKIVEDMIRAGPDVRLRELLC